MAMRTFCIWILHFNSIFQCHFFAGNTLNMDNNPNRPKRILTPTSTPPPQAKRHCQQIEAISLPVDGLMLSRSVHHSSSTRPIASTSSSSSAAAVCPTPRRIKVGDLWHRPAVNINRMEITGRQKVALHRRRFHISLPWSKNGYIDQIKSGHVV